MHDAVIKQLKAETAECARSCEGNVFSDWKVYQIALNYLYGKSIAHKYLPILRSIFVNNHGKKKE